MWKSWKVLKVNMYFNMYETWWRMRGNTLSNETAIFTVTVSNLGKSHHNGALFLVQFSTTDMGKLKYTHKCSQYYENYVYIILRYNLVIRIRALWTSSSTTIVSMVMSLDKWRGTKPCRYMMKHPRKPGFFFLIFCRQLIRYLHRYRGHHCSSICLSLIPGACLSDPFTCFITTDKDLFGYGLRQWETTLHCNVVSHWLSPYLKWSLHQQGYYSGDRFRRPLP